MTDTVELTQHSSARRFGNLLALTRRQRDLSLDDLADASGATVAALHAGRH